MEIFFIIKALTVECKKKTDAVSLLQQYHLQYINTQQDCETFWKGSYHKLFHVMLIMKKSLQEM